MIGVVAPPTWARWRRLSQQRVTLLRALEYEKLEAVHLAGSTLDVGGGAGFGYHLVIKNSGVTHAVNLSAAVAPTVVADLNRPLPIATASYDNVISFNTLEHIEDDRLALNEMIRVLKPGGSFHITVPFLYRRHGRYGDYHRHTAEWWDHALRCMGVPAEQFEIVPLAWSRLSSALAQLSWFGGGLKGRFVRRMVLALPLIAGQSAAGTTDVPLGYYIRGRKPSSAEAGR